MFSGKSILGILLSLGWRVKKGLTLLVWLNGNQKFADGEREIQDSEWPPN
jgi:hypothetical protein